MMHTRIMMILLLFLILLCIGCAQKYDFNIENVYFEDLMSKTSNPADADTHYVHFTFNYLGTDPVHCLVLLDFSQNNQIIGQTEEEIGDFSYGDSRNISIKFEMPEGQTKIKLQPVCD